MSDDPQPSDDDSKTAVFELRNPRPKRPTERGITGGTSASSSRNTIVLSPRAKSPTERRRQAIASAGVDHAAPVPVRASRDRSEPIQVISMKTPAEFADQRAGLAVKQHIVKLQARPPAASIPPQPMGNLAPPRARGSKQVRARKIREYVMWGSTVVVLGCAVTFAIWWIARH